MKQRRWIEKRALAMGSLFKKPRCKCGREMVLSPLGTAYQPCACAPRPSRPRSGPSDISSLCVPSSSDKRMRETKREYVKLGKTWSFSDVEASQPGPEWELVQVLTLDCGGYALWQKQFGRLSSKLKYSHCGDQKL